MVPLTLSVWPILSICRLARRLNTRCPLPSIRRTPINEFNRSHPLLTLAFPSLYPDGKADFDYLAHAMRWQDRRFARHKTRPFVALNTLLRAQVGKRSNYSAKQHEGRRQPLTRADLEEAMAKPGMQVPKHGKTPQPLLWWISIATMDRLGNETCARTQFPLIVAFAIAVHKCQSVTKDQIVTDLATRDFQAGISYVAVSRVTSLQGLLLEAPFDRMNMCLAGQHHRQAQQLTDPPYPPHYID
ncbi:Uncharacterized protein HZ326_29480 [Fusarium oxysporum f. sp. albedinis]|nr:Uncharacterized protein HZ326_29480 [Fusarium oxysporum f. sp. albedinis]